MFSNKTKKLTRFHDPFTVLVNLKDMTYVASDPRGKFADLNSLVSKCKSLPD